MRLRDAIVIGVSAGVTLPVVLWIILWLEKAYYGVSPTIP